MLHLLSVSKNLRKREISLAEFRRISAPRAAASGGCAPKRACGRRQRRNKIKIAISGDMRIGNRTLHPKRFDSFSKKTENLLGCSPLCQKSVAFLTV